MEDETTYIIMFKHTNKEDIYEEDPDSEYGREIHYLSSITKIHTKEVIGYRNMQKEVQEIGEANADNPPYEEYEVVLVYEKESKLYVSKGNWYPDKESN